MIYLFVCVIIATFELRREQWPRLLTWFSTKTARQYLPLIYSCLLFFSKNTTELQLSTKLVV